MSGNLSGFNATEVQPNSFDVVPAGEYEACIVNSVKMATKAGTGAFLSMELQILEGDYKGRKVFDNLNLWNPSEKAVEIARGTLSAICRAVGVLTPGDSSDLHNRPLRIKLGVRTDPQYGDKNEIKAYKPTSGENVGQLPPRGEPAPNDEIPF